MDIAISRRYNAIHRYKYVPGSDSVILQLQSIIIRVFALDTGYVKVCTAVVVRLY